MRSTVLLHHASFRGDGGDFPAIALSAGKARYFFA
jgi:hypothetical protein